MGFGRNSILNQNQQEKRYPRAMQKLQENLETKTNKAISTIYQGLDEATLKMITSAKTSKEAWVILNKTYTSVERAKRVP